MARTTPRPPTIFLSTTSLFSNGAMRRMASCGSAANLNAQIPLAPRVVKWRNVSRRISDAGLFVCEGCGKIFPCELAVAGQDRPQKGANDLAEHKAYRKREPADHGDRAQRKPVNQAIQHAEKSAPYLSNAGSRIGRNFHRTGLDRGNSRRRAAWPHVRDCGAQDGLSGACFRAASR